ncbi:Uncharacterised protein [Vibrio cholerae]|nr:Uncharacterised protein [Vibrio cholerae]
MPFKVETSGVVSTARTRFSELLPLRIFSNSAKLSLSTMPTYRYPTTCPVPASISDERRIKIWTDFPSLGV